MFKKEPKMLWKLCFIPILFTGYSSAQVCETAWVKICAGNSNYAIGNSGTLVNFNSYSSTPAQRWNFKANSDGSMTIINYDNGYALTLAQNCLQNASLTVAVDTNKPTQRFFINSDKSISPVCNTSVFLAYRISNSLILHTKTPEVITQFNIQTV